MTLDIKKGEYTLEQFCKEIETYGETSPFTALFNLAVFAHAYDNTTGDNYPFYGAHAVHCIESMCEDYDGDLEKDFIEGNSLYEASSKFIKYVKDELKKNI